VRVKRVASLALLVALVRPASATAAPLGEVPFERLRHGRRVA
jgi:hypothetical protein